MSRSCFTFVPTFEPNMADLLIWVILYASGVHNTGEFDLET